MQLTEAILHTGILKYSEHMESIKKQLKSLQTGHTHKFKWKVPKSVVYKIAIIILNVTYYNNIIDQQPLSLSCNAAKDPLN